MTKSSFVVEKQCVYKKVHMTVFEIVAHRNVDLLLLLLVRLVTQIVQFAE